MRFIKVKAVGVEYIATLEEAKTELEIVFEGGNSGNVIVFEMIDMPQEDYDKIPELNGF